MRVIVSHHGHFPENPRWPQRWPPQMKVSLTSINRYNEHLYCVFLLFTQKRHHSYW